jgi:hypothetical protein
MARKNEHIPKNMTIEQVCEFWDSHSIADYPSHTVTFEYRPDEHITFVAIANDLLRQLKKRQRNKVPL